MIKALLETDMTPEEMANLAKGKLREKIPQLIEALEGDVSEHHRFLIRNAPGAYGVPQGSGGQA